MSTTVSEPTVSAMQLRKQPGSLLDRVFYRREAFIVERAGEERAALVPVYEYREMKRLKAEAKKRLFAQIKELRAAFAKEKPEEVEKLIAQAIEATRNAKTS